MSVQAIDSRIALILFNLIGMGEIKRLRVNSSALLNVYEIFSLSLYAMIAELYKVSVDRRHQHICVLYEETKISQFCIKYGT